MENLKTLMNEIKVEQNKWRDIPWNIMGRKTQHCQDVSSSQFDLQINHTDQCNVNQNFSKLLHGSQQIGVYLERQKTLTCQYNIVQQSWRTDTTQLQDLL